MSYKKNKKIFSISLLLLFIVILVQPCVSGCSTFAESEGNQPSNVILFSWDGLQREHLLELLGNGSLPNLQAFIDEGCFLNLTVLDHYTQTKPGHAQMLTGYRGRTTGVYSNEVYFHPVPDGYSILERVEEYFGSENVVTCMITGKKRNLEVEKVAPEPGEYCENGIFSNVAEDIDVTRVSQTSSEIVGPRMMQFIEKYGGSHFVAFFHFAEPDEQGHHFGENSAEYDRGVIACDRWLGKILDKLESMKIENATNIYIMTDHGFQENGFIHINEPLIWMATNDLRLKVNENQTLCDMIDIAPTIYYALGINKTIFSPPLEGYPLQERLLKDAGRRMEILNDEKPPVIQFDRSKINNEMNINGSLKIKFMITDENIVIGYLLLNNNLLKIFKSGNVIDLKERSLNVIEKEYNINLSEINYMTKKLKIIAFDETENINIKEISLLSYIKTTSINIYIKDKWGTPLNKATITSTSHPAEQSTLIGTTDSDGFCAFIDVKAGIYSFKSAKRGYKPEISSLSIKVEEKAEKYITLEKKRSILGVISFSHVSFIIGILTGATFFIIIQNIRVRRIAHSDGPENLYMLDIATYSALLES